MLPDIMLELCKTSSRPGDSPCRSFLCAIIQVVVVAYFKSEREFFPLGSMIGQESHNVAQDDDVFGGEVTISQKEEPASTKQLKCCREIGARFPDRSAMSKSGDSLEVVDHAYFPAGLVCNCGIHAEIKVLLERRPRHYTVPRQ